MTSGRPGQVFMICSMRSNASLASCLNLNAPWLVPIATASESHLVRCQKSFACTGSVRNFSTFFSYSCGVDADDVFLDAAEHAQLGLDDHARRVRELHRVGGELDVLLVRVVAAVDHDATCSRR